MQNLQKPFNTFFPIIHLPEIFEQFSVCTCKGCSTFTYMHKQTIHTHPHVQVISILSTVAEYNICISVVEDSPLRWIKEHGLHLLNPPDPQPWLSNFMGKLALCRPQIKHHADGGNEGVRSLCARRGRGLRYEKVNK